MLHPFFSVVAHLARCRPLSSRLHKPAQQTVLPADAVPVLLGPLPIPKLKGLGGKFGEQASLGGESAVQGSLKHVLKREIAMKIW